MAVFSWGLNKAGQLGLGHRQSCTVPQPVRLPVRDAAVHVSSGGHFTSVVTSRRQQYAFGCGKYGRLGVDRAEEDCLKPVLVVAPTPVVRVACGSWHACALTEEGNIFIWGYGRTLGSAGKAAGKWNAVPLPINAFREVSVSTVSCGHNFTLACTSTGQAFSWGVGRNGVLGHGSEDDCLEPTEIKALSSVHTTTVDAGYALSATVTADGHVYTFGKTTSGALGHSGGVHGVCCTPRKVDGLDGTLVKSVSCSVGEHHSHTLALSTDGVVFSWGDGYKGKLGHGDQESQKKPKPIAKEHFGAMVAMVAAGGIHSAAVTVDGGLFTWGCGSDGRLGHPEAEGHRYLFRSLVPRRVDGFPKGSRVTDVSCSYYHTVCVVKQEVDTS